MRPTKRDLQDGIENSRRLARNAIQLGIDDETHPKLDPVRPTKRDLQDGIRVDPYIGLVEQFYCRVLQRPPESEDAIVEWVDYLESNTVKGMVRAGILSEEFKLGFVNGKSNETLARTLYDVLLARAGDAGGLVTWAEQISIHGWDSAVDSILASGEYNDNFGDDAVPGGGRAECGPQMPSQSPSKELSTMPSQSPSKDPSKMLLVEQFYCRVLQRPPESAQAIVVWLDYLKSHSIKDLVRLGILGDEFKTNFVNGKSGETLKRTLFDVLLARAPDAFGFDTWAEQISIHGWDSAVNSILASGEYIENFGDDAVPGGGRAECGPQMPLQSPS
jgi:hypothetical protein